MGKICSISGCKSRPRCGNLFPSALEEPLLRKEWIWLACREISFIPNKLDIVCNRHFIDGKPTSAHPCPTLGLPKNRHRLTTSIRGMRIPQARKSMDDEEIQIIIEKLKYKYRIVSKRPTPAFPKVSSVSSLSHPLPSVPCLPIEHIEVPFPIQTEHNYCYSTSELRAAFKIRAEANDHVDEEEIEVIIPVKLPAPFMDWSDNARISQQTDKDGSFDSAQRKREANFGELEINFNTNCLGNSGPPSLGLMDVAGKACGISIASDNERFHSNHLKMPAALDSGSADQEPSDCVQNGVYLSPYKPDPGSKTSYLIDRKSKRSARTKCQKILIRKLRNSSLQCMRERYLSAWIFYAHGASLLLLKEPPAISCSLCDRVCVNKHHFAEHILWCHLKSSGHSSQSANLSHCTNGKTANDLPRIAFSGFKEMRVLVKELKVDKCELNPKSVKDLALEINRFETFPAEFRRAVSILNEIFPIAPLHHVRLDNGIELRSLVHNYLLRFWDLVTGTCLFCSWKFEQASDIASHICRAHFVSAISCIKEIHQPKRECQRCAVRIAKDISNDKIDDRNAAQRASNKFLRQSNVKGGEKFEELIKEPEIIPDRSIPNSPGHSKPPSNQKKPLKVARKGGRPRKRREFNFKRIRNDSVAENTSNDKIRDDNTIPSASIRNPGRSNVKKWEKMEKLAKEPKIAFDRTVPNPPRPTKPPANQKAPLKRVNKVGRPRKKDWPFERSRNQSNSPSTSIPIESAEQDIFRKKKVEKKEQNSAGYFPNKTNSQKANATRTVQKNNGRKQKGRKKVQKRKPASKPNIFGNDESPRAKSIENPAQICQNQSTSGIDQTIITDENPENGPYYSFFETCSKINVFDQLINFDPTLFDENSATDCPENNRPMTIRSAKNGYFGAEKRSTDEIIVNACDIDRHCKKDVPKVGSYFDV